MNVRRPGAARSAVPHAKTWPQPELRPLDDAPLPQTVLRLPDLPTFVKLLPENQTKLAAVGSIAQWVAIGLGGLLALWLIFGGRSAPLPEANEAPPWTPPGETQADTAAPAWNAAAKSANSPAPAWQSPMPAPAVTDPNTDPNVQPSESNEPAPPEFPADEDPWNSAAHAASGPAVRTAQRVGVAGETVPADSRPAEAPPLGITVPVPQ